MNETEASLIAAVAAEIADLKAEMRGESVNATQIGLTDLAMLLGPDHPGAEVCMTANKEIAALHAEVERLREVIDGLSDDLWYAHQSMTAVCESEPSADRAKMCERIWAAYKATRAALEEKP